MTHAFPLPPSCVHTDLADNWTSSSQPSASASTKRWNIRGEALMVHRTLIHNVASICFTWPYCTIAVFTIKGIHEIPLLFLWIKSKCLSWHFLYRVTGRFKDVLYGATSLQYCEKIWSLSHERHREYCMWLVVLSCLHWSYQLRDKALLLLLFQRTLYKTLS